MIEPDKYGVSFSIKQCRNLGLDPHEVLEWLLAQGWRRFRLMSYWDEHEHSPGEHDFRALDWQITAIAAAGGTITLCLGAKQPRWPEYHWPDWAWQLPKSARRSALIKYIERVVSRYARWDAIDSWQLENEALLHGFGERIEIDRTRLTEEFAAVRRLDNYRPIAMSTSNGWGIPLRGPIPNCVGLSYYLKMFKNGAYHDTIQKPWLHRLRASCIRILFGKPVFIHELQCEPWGPKALWEMQTVEQDKSMNPDQIRHNLLLARKIGLYPIDLWGGEWWFWRYKQGDANIWSTVKKGIS